MTTKLYLTKSNKYIKIMKGGYMLSFILLIIIINLNNKIKEMDIKLTNLSIKLEKNIKNDEEK